MASGKCLESRVLTSVRFRVVYSSLQTSSSTTKQGLEKTQSLSKDEQVRSAFVCEFQRLMRGGWLRLNAITWKRWLPLFVKAQNLTGKPHSQLYLHSSKLVLPYFQTQFKFHSIFQQMPLQSMTYYRWRVSLSSSIVWKHLKMTTPK